MLKHWGIDVVASGHSLHDRSSFYLMRSYENLADLERSEDAFYGSDEWRLGPRAAILACIESYTSTVIEVDDATLTGLRQGG
jgi:hypothetical protein